MACIDYLVTCCATAAALPLHDSRDDGAEMTHSGNRVGSYHHLGHEWPCMNKAKLILRWGAPILLVAKLVYTITQPLSRNCFWTMEFPNFWADPRKWLKLTYSEVCPEPPWTPSKSLTSSKGFAIVPLKHILNRSCLLYSLYDFWGTNRFAQFHPFFSLGEVSI